MSTGFDVKSIDLLSDLNIPIYKTLSGEITNLPLLRHIGQKNKPVIMSSGMSFMSEIKKARDILFESGLNKSKLTILHCNSEYPTPYSDVNMNAMISIRKQLGVKIGYSDHTLGIDASLVAVSLGASVIEKHFTPDKNMSGPDHGA